MLGINTDTDGLVANGTLAALGLAATPTKGTAAGEALVGSAKSDFILGLAGNNSLTGGSGFDTLDGGAGADFLDGGDGDDLYVVDNVKDFVSEGAVDSNDRILASISIDLSDPNSYDRIEHVTLTGLAALNATGDGGANMLIGNAGANKLNGGAGADTLVGGAGNDIYTVDKQADVILEFADGGIDQVISSSSFVLFDFIENLTLVGTAGPTGVNGNALANKITGDGDINGLSGFGGNDTLTGNGGDDGLDGGAGADLMVGGSGNNSYGVDDVGDKIVESGPSTDHELVDSSINYILGANLEDLFLSGTAVEGTGNALGNHIQGSNENNLLVGLGGNDSLAGFAGKDLEMGGDGNDTLEAWIADADTLVGGSGADLFRLNGNASIGAGHIIADFDMLGGDKIELTSLLIGTFDPSTSNIADFLRTTTVNGSTIIERNFDGVGADFEQVFTLQGVSTDVAGLIETGVLVSLPAFPAAAPTKGGAAANSLDGGGESDLIFGLAGDDTLNGLGGADTLDGSAGKDALVGFTGNDTYIVDSAGDLIFEGGADTDDRIVASISIDLKNYTGIEHVDSQRHGSAECHRRRQQQHAHRQQWLQQAGWRDWQRHHDRPRRKRCLCGGPDQRRRSRICGRGHRPGEQFGRFHPRRLCGEPDPVRRRGLRNRQ